MATILSLAFIKHLSNEPAIRIGINAFKERKQEIKYIEKYLREKYVYNKDYYEKPRIIFVKNENLVNQNVMRVKDPILINFYKTIPEITEVRLERGDCGDSTKFNRIIFNLQYESKNSVNIINDDCMKSDFKNFKNKYVEIVKVDTNWQISVENRW
ncbi:hypothetical protein Fleli_0062 [Bernardetia litoralis DSM 6794]|uniref:Uncharacterized protein n=1 Tax=Bernardetia litoralis (strain ATCC 23117 / DSM 6794 / NBRC 15988 / NCIMB 1366 / Fx l1 / Sio-4) TaxID=880071 RepID=I4AF37_BERLS|nr:hypothetical protein [Bernardetia litoralis]AFM02572.1 hypothetical protein Fleli_0062 [Bernardetia litoralis DSM 6794]